MYKVLNTLFLAIMLIFSAVANADIYKWRDERGVMHYSDMPPPAGSSAEKLGTGKMEWPLTSADAPSKNTSSEAVNAPLTKSKEPTPEKIQPVNAAKAMEERLKAANCANARTNYRNYAVGGRIQSINENGEKAFMSDEEIRDGLARAQQEIDANCPSS